MRRKNHRPLQIESLERREVFAGGLTVSSHNVSLAADVNNDAQVSTRDALLIINEIGRQRRGEETTGAAADYFYDVNADGNVSVRDALRVINSIGQTEAEKVAPDPIILPPSEPVAQLINTDPGKAPGVGSTFQATFNAAETINPDENLLTAADVETLLDRASMASRTQDAIIAIVDRSGQILGVRVEAEVLTAFAGDEEGLAFAIDGAVAKARTAAFFASNEAPLTSRTIRSLSQTTITQREVESSSTAADTRYQGPGLVAPIGVGGHFPPQIAFTPQVDLLAIEHQSRDSSLHAGANGIKESSIDAAGNTVVGGDDFLLENRFNANGDFVPAAADEFFNTFPESYGFVSGTSVNAQSRGIATLPGGVPLYKTVLDANGNAVTTPVSASINLVGGIGVFFPGEDGYATHEQNFIHTSERTGKNRGKTQTEAARTNATKVLEAEFIALAAASGNNKLVAPRDFVRDFSFINRVLPAAPRFVALSGRIDLVGITLEIYGPNPTSKNRKAGIDQLIAAGKRLGPGISSGTDVSVTRTGDLYLAGNPVPEQWLVAPHASAQAGGLSAADVEQIIMAGVAQAEVTRAAIRLDVDNGFRPGARTGMVLSVTDTNGELLGLFRMPDATIFSIDVSVAKARNTAYYADPVDLLPTDRLDFNGDGVFGSVSTSVKESGDTVPLGTAFTNRTFRFIVEPRYPTGRELPKNSDRGLVNDANLTLRDQKEDVARAVGPESILQMPGINPRTGENLDNNNPLPRSVYTNVDNSTILAFESFVPSRNFRDPGDAEVVINGTGVPQPLANQNGIVFFPGSTPLYLDNNASRLVGGFGVSGDGVDQDDVVTAAGQVGFAPPQSIRVDSFTIGKVRLPFQKFNRNPQGD